MSSSSSCFRISAQTSEPLPGSQKAAVLLVILGEQVGAEILKHLDEEDIQRVSREVARLNSVTPEQAEAVLEEFYQMMVAHDYVLKGGIDYARKVLVNAFGSESAKRMLD